MGRCTVHAGTRAGRQGLNARRLRVSVSHRRTVTRAGGTETRRCEGWRMLWLWLAVGHRKWARFAQKSGVWGLRGGFRRVRSCVLQKASCRRMQDGVRRARTQRHGGFRVQRPWQMAWHHERAKCELKCHARRRRERSVSVHRAKQQASTSTQCSADECRHDAVAWPWARCKGQHDHV